MTRRIVMCVSVNLYQQQQKSILDDFLSMTFEEQA